MPAWPTNTTELVAYLQAHPAVMCHYTAGDADEREPRTFVDLQYPDTVHPQINWLVTENGGHRHCSYREDEVRFDAAGFSPGAALQTLRYNYVDPPWLTQLPAAAVYPTTRAELEAYLTAHPQVWLVGTDGALASRVFQRLLPAHLDGPGVFSILWNADGTNTTVGEENLQYDADGFTVNRDGVSLRYLYDARLPVAQVATTDQAAVASTYPTTLAELNTYLQVHPQVGCELNGGNAGVRTFQGMALTSVAGMFRINWLDEGGDQAHCFISADTASFDADGVSVGDENMPGDLPPVRYTYRPGDVTRPVPSPVTVPVASTHFSQMQLINQLRHDWNEKCAELTAAQIAAEHMQRRLDEIKAERDALRAVTAKDVWYWQDDNSNYLESLTCRIVITADQLRKLLAERKPPVASSHIIRRLK